MGQNNKFLTLALVVVIGAVLQGLLVLADCKDIPHRVAVDFSKAYFKLDSSMTDLLCEESRMVDDVDVVEQYIDQAVADVKMRGFGENFAKNQLYGIHTHTTFKGKDNALVKLTGKRRVAINPVYPIISKIFSLGETYHVEAEINTIREEGKWKVCDDLLSLYSD